MKIEIVVPSPGESIAEVELATWMVANGSWVEKDQEIAEIESEKATLPLLAAQSGKLTILIEEGTVAVGAVVGTIDTSVQREEGEEKKEDTPQPEEKKVEKTQEIAAPSASTSKEEKGGFEKVKVTPVAQKMMAEKGLNLDDIISGLQRIDSGHVKSVLAQNTAPSTASPTSREQVREPMSQLRKKLSQRLVAVKNETAMLTTFNEVDMSNIIALRKDNQKAFVEKHGIKLGFMSLFAKAVVEGLKQYPLVNSYIENEEIVTPNYYDIGIAVQTPKGLMVPVVRSAEGLTIPKLEQEIQQLAEKGRKGRIGLDELTGGTFTITNGGIFGSLLSTPLLNPPQSGILGMHNIVERPVAVNGKVEIRPMMYIALSYDHRLIDGRDAVSFLVAVKQQIENPELMLMGGRDMGQLLLDL